MTFCPLCQTALLSTLFLSYALILTDLSGCPAGTSLVQFSLPLFWAVLHIPVGSGLLVQSLASCTPACSMVSATLSILLTCSPSFISSHLAFHCLSLDVPLSSWWYEPSPTLPPKHLFLIPSQFLPALSHLDTQRVVVQSLAHPMRPDYAQNLRLQTFEEI